MASEEKQTVLVTGSNRGIGLELCKQLLERGWKVLGACRKPEAAEDLNKLQQENKESLQVFAMDVGNDESVVAAEEKIKAAGVTAIDLIINNAGVFSPAAFADNKVSDYEFAFNVNVMGVLRVVNAFIDLVRASNSATRSICTISSHMGSISNNNFGTRIAYRVSKSAVNSFIKCASIDLNADKNTNSVIFTAIHPGWVATDMGSSGGRKPPLSPPDSVNGILSNVVDKLDASYNGVFYSFTGEVIPH